MIPSYQIVPEKPSSMRRIFFYLALFLPTAANLSGPREEGDGPQDRRTKRRVAEVPPDF